MRIRQVSGARGRFTASRSGDGVGVTRLAEEQGGVNNDRMTPRGKRIVLGAGSGGGVHLNRNRIVSGQRVVSGRGVRLGTPGRQTMEDESGDEDDLGEDGDDHDDSVVNIGFHQNKRQILSNFEEWLKLSNSNKINSKNSWNVSLIDYFYDMNVMKGQDGINFQVASATLDGCVKVYQSRVDSAVSETGKLLSGLSQKNVANNELEVDDEDNDGEEGVDGSGDQADGENAEGEGRKRRKINKVVESTLVEFETIRLRKFEQELAIDPLFKKALAEFDEGGAKSLLLNSLSIDATGRVVFDATMAQEDSEEDKEDKEDKEGEHEDKEMSDSFTKSSNEFSMEKLANFVYCPTSNDANDNLETMTICPSMDELQAVLEDISRAKTLIENVNHQIQADTAAGASALETIGTNEYPSFNDNDNFAPDFGNDNFDMDIEDENNNHDDDDHDDEGDPIDNLNKSIVQQVFNEDEQYTERSVPERVMDRDLMAYFDERLKSSWRGPENWRVTAFKNAMASNNQNSKSTTTTSITSGSVVKTEDGGESMTNVTAKKKATTIDFMSTEDDEELEQLIFAKAKKLGTITYDEDQEMLLPEDIQFRSSKLTHLFTKPSVPIYTFRKVKKTAANYEIKTTEDDENKITDENYFAEQYKNRELLESFIQAEEEDFNNDYGGNNDFGGIDFNDAFEGDAVANSTHNHIIDGEEKSVNPFLESQDRPDTQDSAMTNESQSQYRRRRPEYVNFSRVAKRVDVKRLKDNIWLSIQRQAQALNVLEASPKPQEEEEEEVPKNNEKVESFRNIVTDVNKYYGAEERKDLSTSFHFICLLHLANEHGLSIVANSAHDDLRITGF
ncbi:uncharacterized protein KQ657_004204 [Scheffersomyces spartinae]|uniref:Condensin complex subunit 2 n=1 Tax=Scheffersomyces spartinae TaxID=45513 RepID=A0A9P8AJ46_9ASCO|nr:uncharacterized protein KQ657_004204 [Scheffersomyces spartinae]KAG7195088.1 hypothetical protein KQ657_004204 [Scheffersomyces spartinae]